jgi:hypothetical protein
MVVDSWEEYMIPHFSSVCSIAFQPKIWGEGIGDVGPVRWAWSVWIAPLTCLPCPRGHVQTTLIRLRLPAKDALSECIQLFSHGVIGSVSTPGTNGRMSFFIVLPNVLLHDLGIIDKVRNLVVTGNDEFVVVYFLKTLPWSYFGG